MSEKYLIQTVRNAMQILRLFTDEKREWTLTEIANEKDWSPATTYRLLKTLEQYQYIERNDSKQYKLGLSILRLSGMITATTELHSQARSVATELVHELGEAVHIGILEDTETIYLHKIDSIHPVRLASHIGKQLPTYSSGCGKVILAHRKENVRDEIIAVIEEKGFQPLASKTVQSADELREDLIAIKEKGYALCVNEVSEGITSIAAPIFDHTGEVVAGISITGPNNRIPIENGKRRVVEAGKRISENLGFYAYKEEIW